MTPPAPQPRRTPRPPAAPGIPDELPGLFDPPPAAAPPDGAPDLHAAPQPATAPPPPPPGAAPRRPAARPSPGPTAAPLASSPAAAVSGTAPAPDPTVSELVARIRKNLEAGIGETWVRGEISNLRLQSSGHRYFTLKDERAQIACALFAGSPAARVRVANGEEVRLFGRVTVYEPQGQMQIIVRRIELAGAGALQARFEELKRRLAAEGLFDPARKRPLPALPLAVGLVTSASGAAVRDILHVLGRRAPYARVFIRPVRVQGEGAAAQIAAAVRGFSEWEQTGFPRVDVLIVGRGGGSIEDLWAFNEEIVARALFACRIPVISGVGHETDFTIADFVADRRAPTPSAAAEMAAPDRAQLLGALGRLRFAVRRETALRFEALEARLRAVRGGAGMREPERRLAEAAQTLDRLAELARLHTARRLSAAADRLAALERAVAQMRPARVLARYAERLRGWREALPGLAARALAGKQAALEALARQARLLGPEATLARGYSITRLADGGRIIRDAAAVPLGARLETLLARGRIFSVTAAPEPPASPGPAGAAASP